MKFVPEDPIHNELALNTTGSHFSIQVSKGSLTLVRHELRSMIGQSGQKAPKVPRMKSYALEKIHAISTRDKSYFSRENVPISRNINFSWKFSRANAICNTTRVIHHVIRAFISRGVEPDVYIRGFSFIFEEESEEMAAFVSILRRHLTSLMAFKPAKNCE